MEKDKYRGFDKRIGCLQFCFLAFIVLFLIYLFLLQIFDIRHYKERAKTQRASKLFVLRGEILDRNGFKLAVDETSFDLYAHPKYYDHSPQELADKLFPYVGGDKVKLVHNLSSDDSVILIKKGITRKAAEAIRAMKLREISLEVKNKRAYPQGSLAAHVLGYYNSDADVAAGVEYIAKDYLEYFDKSITFEKTPNGDLIYNLSTNPEAVSAPIKGKTLNLTIDSAVQHVCERHLYRGIQKTYALRGAVIAMDPKSGEILAMAVYPYYDPNNYRKYSLLEMKNWALTDVYPPGSTFKIITVASAFINGKINKYTKILDTGKIKIGWWEIQNHDYEEDKAPGLIDLVYLFQHSSNVASVKVAQKMDDQEFYDTLEMFNFGQKTGIDLPGESAGILPKPKNWDSATHGSMGYGYGTSVTAIQMAAAVSAIANGGEWVTPHIIKYSPKEAEEKIIRRRIMTPEMSKDLTDILVESIDRSKSIAKMKDFRLAAKTGTSRRPKDNGVGYTNKMYTSMVGYLPATDPKVLIYIVIDSAKGDVWGSTVAAPIFKDISTELARIMNLNPDRDHPIKTEN